MRFWKITVAQAAALVTVATSAQQPSPQTAALLAAVPQAACELHVWPGNGLRSVYYGWFHGGIVDGAVNGRQGYPAVPKDPVPTELQAELLAKAGLPALLGKTGYAIILHPEALDSRTIRTTAGRITAAPTSCYAELMVDDMFFQQDVFSGGYLKSTLRFRDFGDGTAPLRVFGTSVSTRLTHFPPKPDRPQDNEAALSEIRAAFATNIALFGKALASPLKPGKRP